MFREQVAQVLVELEQLDGSDQSVADWALARMTLLERLGRAEHHSSSRSTSAISSTPLLTGTVAA